MTAAHNRTAPKLFRPSAHETHFIFFILPSAYWTERWHTTLDLPARALLLIMLHGTSSKAETYLPYEKAESWYGISAKTTQRGIDELRDKGLLVVTRRERVVADVSATGHHPCTYYALTGPSAVQLARSCRPARHPSRRHAQQRHVPSGWNSSLQAHPPGDVSFQQVKATETGR